MRIVSVILFLVSGPFTMFGQPYPNPYRAVDTWATFPDGRRMGAVGDVQVDPDGVHIWAVVRCDSAEPGRFGNECLDSDLDPVVKFDAEGNAVESFGGGLFIWPHGLFVDEESNVWVTDAVNPTRTPEGTRGHQVIKFSATGEELMRLGIPGKAGKGDYQFNAPADVVIGDNGNIFIADGHNPDGNNRVMVYDKEGTFLRTWGQTGYAPGEFHALHAMALDKKGRLFVADRFNNRLQIFDQDGTFIAQWTQFGRPSGVFFDDHGNIYVSDSESDNVQNPGYEMGIRIGDAETGWVNYFIFLPNGDPRLTRGNGAEFVTVDAAGNVYGGEPFARKVQKYVRVRP